MSKNMIYIGYVAKTHGLHGILSIKLEGSEEFCQLCAKICNIYIEAKVFSVKKAELNSKIFIRTQLNEIRTREEAKIFLRKNIYIDENEYPAIKQLIQKQNQLITFEVIDTKNNIIGHIKSIDYNRLQPIMIITKNEKEILAPYIKEFISKIDIKSKKVFVDFPEGLIETCFI